MSPNKERLIQAVRDLYLNVDAPVAEEIDHRISRYVEELETQIEILKGAMREVQEDMFETEIEAWMHKRDIILTNMEKVNDGQNAHR